MAERTIGRCSNCGGNVRIYVGPWYGINPPEARCDSCGAGVRRPTIDMDLAPLQKEAPTNESPET